MTRLCYCNRCAYCTLTRRNGVLLSEEPRLAPMKETHPHLFCATKGCFANPYGRYCNGCRKRKQVAGLGAEPPLRRYTLGKSA